MRNTDNQLTVISRISTNEASCHADVGGVMVQLHAFLIQLHGDEALRPGRLFPQKACPVLIGQYTGQAPDIS
jgi:hypothetical protein